MPENIALGARAAGAPARVDALVVVARLVCRALIVAHTLGPAGNQGVPKVPSDTGAYRSAAVVLSADGVRTAG